MERCKASAAEGFVADAWSDLLEECALVLGELGLRDEAVDLAESVLVPARRPLTVARLASIVSKECDKEQSADDLLAKAFQLSSGLSDAWDRSRALAITACNASAAGHTEIATDCLQMIDIGDSQVAFILDELDEMSSSLTFPEVVPYIEQWMRSTALGIENARLYLRALAMLRRATASGTSSPFAAHAMARLEDASLDPQIADALGGDSELLAYGMSARHALLVASHMSDPWQGAMSYVSILSNASGSSDHEEAASRAVDASESIEHPGLRDQVTSVLSLAVAEGGDVERGIKIALQVSGRSARNRALGNVLRLAGADGHNYLDTVVEGVKDPGGFWACLTEIVLAPGEWPYIEDRKTVVLAGIAADRWSRGLASEKRG